MRAVALLLLLLPGCTFEAPSIPSAVKRCQAYHHIFDVAAQRCMGLNATPLDCSNIHYFDVDLERCRADIEAMTCDEARMLANNVPSCWFTKL